MNSHVVAAFVICVATYATGDIFLESDLEGFNVEKAISDFFANIRHKRDADTKTTDEAKVGGGLMGGPPPPPGGPGGPPPHGGPGGPPPGGPGGPPPGGPGGPPPGGHGGPPPGGPRGPMHCCKIPKIMNEDIKKASNSCATEVFGKRTKDMQKKQENRRHRGGPNGCYEECMFKNQSLITSDNTVDTAKLLTLIQKNLDNTESSSTWKPLFEQAIANCSGATSTTTTKESTDNTCKSGAHKLIWCCRKYFIMNCPTTAWTDSTECEEHRKRIASGPPKKQLN